MAVTVEQRHSAAKSVRSAGGLHFLSFRQVVIKGILSVCVCGVIAPSTTQRLNKKLTVK